MQRVAFCTPVNPVESGISDYSEELLPYLGQYVDLTLVVDVEVQPTNQQLLAKLPIIRISDLAKQHARQPFDAIIYHMGNSPAHSRFWQSLQRLPGIVVLHDYVLHHLMLWHAANRLKNVASYRQLMQHYYAEQGTSIAQRMERGQLGDAVFDFPLSEPVIAQASSLIAHSQYVLDRVQQQRPNLATSLVPMGVPLLPPPDRLAARQALQLPADVPIWASFGHINPYKRIEQALQAFAQFRRTYPDARYILVGSVSPSYDLKALLQRLQLGESVQVTGYVDHADFNRYVAAADLCFNGRYPSAGETSASLLRLLGAGRAVLVSDIATFSELPADVVAHVPVDRDEVALIAAYAQRLWADVALREAMETNARRYVAEKHSLPLAARGYADHLSRVQGWPRLEPQRELLWDINNVTIQHSITQTIGHKAAQLGLVDDDAPLLDRLAARLRNLLT